MDRKRGIEMITDTIEAGAEKITTKEKILEVSLALFAQKGYSNVYVNEIALAVGIKAPSLYKHFKNKQDIFDCCIKVFLYLCIKLKTHKYDTTFKTVTNWKSR